MSNEAQQFRDMAEQILSPVDSKGAALFRYAADAIDERDLLKSQNANSLGETQEQFKRTAHESSELSQLKADNTQLRKEAEALKAKTDKLDKAHQEVCRQLHFVQSELDKAHADGAAMREALELALKFDDVVFAHARFPKSKIQLALSADAGRDLLSRYREAVDLVKVVPDWCMSEHWKARRDALLATVKGEVES